MLEKMVKSVINKTLTSDYPYLMLPAVTYAIVSKVQQLSMTYESEELVIHSNESGGSYRGHIVAHWYEYGLTIIDRFGIVDGDYPPLPGIKSKKQFQSGAVVAVAFPHGDITPVIIGEVIL